MDAFRCVSEMRTESSTLITWLQASSPPQEATAQGPARCRPSCRAGRRADWRVRGCVRLRVVYSLANRDFAVLLTPLLLLVFHASGSGKGFPRVTMAAESQSRWIVSVLSVLALSLLSHLAAPARATTADITRTMQEQFLVYYNVIDVQRWAMATAVRPDYSPDPGKHVVRCRSAAACPRSISSCQSARVRAQTRGA